MKRMVHWLEDAVVCIWALMYWNARKSRYVLGRRLGRCPCQDPSDIGSSRPVHCDASQHLNKPIRFRHVCPLLVPGAGGKGAFCSVKPHGVQPFWGRALKFFVGALLVLYVAGIAVFFLGLRATGVNTLSVRQVVWPGAWGQIKQERSKFFFMQAISACARQDYQRAFRSMATALTLDSHNYDARLLMAQYSEFADEFLTGDRFFKALMYEFPQMRVRTAITFHDTLLAVGRHEILAIHCLDMAAENNPDRSTWTGSLLLAMHLGKLGPEFLAKHPDKYTHLEPDARRLVQAQALLNDGKVNEARADLRHAFTSPVNANYVIQQIRLFLRTGSPADAEVAWAINARNLLPFERQLARCWIDHGLGYASLAGMEFSSLAAGHQTEQNLDKLVATLVMQPNPDAFQALHRRMLAAQHTITVQTTGEMWLASLVCQAPKERDYWAQISKERFHMSYPLISNIRYDSRAKNQEGAVPFLVNTGVFSRETITELYWKTPQDAGTNNK